MSFYDDDMTDMVSTLDIVNIPVNASSGVDISDYGLDILLGEDYTAMSQPKRVRMPRKIKKFRKTMATTYPVRITRATLRKFNRWRRWTHAEPL